MDIVDAKIIELLTANSRMAGAEIARKVHLSLPAVTERMRKLTESGIISAYTIRLSPEVFGWNLKAFIKVWVNHEEAEDIVTEITKCRAVMECHHMAGDYDLLLKVMVSGTAALEDFLTKELKVIKGVTRTSTTIALSTYLERLNPLPNDGQ